MRKGFQKLTLGLLTAALLSGSAFAAGPTISGLPTVIITDKMTETEVGANPATPFDYMATDTQNIYRFTDAFPLADYVTLATGDPDAPAKDQVNYLFTESDTLGAQVTGAARTIQINDQFAFDATAAPSVAEINTANQDVVAAGALDFRNAAANPDDMPQVTPGITLPAEAIITMFVAADNGTSGTEPNVDAFSVITTDGGAYLSDTLGPATISGVTFTEVGNYGQFDNWNNLALDGVADPTTIPYNNTSFKAAAMPQLLPATTLIENGADDYQGAPPGTNTIQIITAGNPGLATGATIPAQYAFWQSGYRGVPESLVPRVDVTEGKMYLVRWQLATNVAASNTAVLQAQKDIRFSMGDPAKELIGQGTDEVGNSNPTPYHIDSTGRLHNTLFYAHTDGKLGLRFDAYDFGADVGYLNITLDSVVVYEFDRSDLENELVVFNNGAASVTLAAGETAPPDTGRADFTLNNDLANPAGVWNFLSVIPTGTGARTFATTGTNANVLVASTASTSSSAMGHWSWEANGPGIQTPFAEAVQLPYNKWAFMDVWLSSPVPTVNLPDMRIEMLGYGNNNVTNGRNTQFEWNPSLFTTQAVTEFPLAMQTGARRFTVAVDPQLRATTDTIGIRPMVLGLCYDGNPDTNTGTVNINRVVVTTYDIPTNLP